MHYRTIKLFYNPEILYAYKIILYKRLISILHRMSLVMRHDDLPRVWSIAILPM